MAFDAFQQQLGPLAIPLAVLSFLVLILVIERFLALFMASVRRRAISEVDTRLSALTATGVQLIAEHGSEKKEIREEIAAIWLLQMKRKLSSGIRLLQVIAVIAPLLGLFGTVLGLIKVFDDLSVVSGAIEPSMLAEGLGLAMYTTAAGLLIAVPAITGAHGFSMWVDKIIHNTEHAMNQFNLMVDGVQVRRCNSPITQFALAVNKSVSSAQEDGGNTAATPQRFESEKLA